MSTSSISAARHRGLASQRCPATGELAPNRICEFGTFHISYNPHATQYGCETTALVLAGRVFFVLNGDHTDAMLSAAERNGIEGCIDIFVNQLHLASELSEHRMAVGISADPFALAPTALELIGQDNVARIAAAHSRIEHQPA
ncbi:hypothetical protein H8Z72_22500 (plasmid) [Xanthomonas citri pv. citri]|uniref:hypothetical protein n=1 Tax=Xanthomonas citri TaxID=346 RepID=UPI0019333FC8|nr:hypothetical protein [Xanthomonas citri]QRD62699.1 hypothetical protein H8Z74_22580 [Xanthomonas citri pv. citri]QRD67234.1 hypothetical protein H8Z73_22665 [Xanthomonas citri pv. citri]QRD71721.1 hypothetical protein H8Z72_22500 [Xanthomonas citri pv. citri]